MTATNRLRRSLPSLAALALALAATACSDVVQPAPVEAPVATDRSNLASVAVATLVQSRAGGFQIVIPDETRTESEAIVLYLHGPVTDRFRFVRGNGGWELAQHLDSATDPAADEPARGPVLDRGTWNTAANIPSGTPGLAHTVFSWPDGTMPDNVALYPLRYSYNGNAYRWTVSAEVVSGYEDAAKLPRQASFDNANALQWNTADSVFVVDAYRQWTFGDVYGQRFLCGLGASPGNSVCSPTTATFSAGPFWADGAYHITVQKRVPSIVTVSPATLEGIPGQTAQLSAQVRDQNGLVMPATVTWTSSNPAVATVSSTGLVTIHAFGSATITGTAGTASGTTAISSRVAVSLNGPYAIYEGWTTATSSVNPAGSYYYVWTYDRCDYRETEYKCIFAKPLTSGQNVASAQIYVSKYDAFVRYRVSVRQSSTGSEIGRAELKVNGGNQVFVGGGGCPIGSRTC